MAVRNRQLLLINPAMKDLSMGKRRLFGFPPLNLGYIAALTPSNWNVRIIDENVDTLDVSEYDDIDLVGITSTTANIPRAYELAHEFRENGIKTIIGGVHASFLPAEAIRFVDCVVIGEAEGIWNTVLADFESSKLKEFYYGNKPDLCNLITPRRDLYSGKYRIPNIQASRGCPMNCDFCSVTSFSGATYRQRPANEVLEEMRTIPGKLLYFVDDNLAGHTIKSAENTKRLLRGMIIKGIEKRWAAQVSVNFANDSELLDLARDSGCFALFIGFESLNEKSLEQMNKSSLVKVEVLQKLIEEIHKRRILIYGAFILGYDHDRTDVFENTLQFIIDNEIDMQQIAVPTPLPGTKLYERLRDEGRLLFTNYPEDWKQYRLNKVVFKPWHMSPEELQNGLLWVHERLCSIRRLLQRAFHTLRNTRAIDLSVLSFYNSREQLDQLLRRGKFK